MSNYENNPFSGEAENPFADPSVASMTSSAAQGLEDFNPFADQNVSKPTQEPPSTTTPVVPPPRAEPPREPAVLEPQQQPPPPYVIEEEHENLRKRQEELEKKASELQKKEQELQRMQLGGYRENNYPPLPSKCPCKPCFFHDISIDIPIEYQKTCKFLFYRWQWYSFTLFYNFLAAFALLVDNDDEYHGGETFGLSLLYLVANIPLSFLGWYRPAYNALNAMALLISDAGGAGNQAGETFGLSLLYFFANVPLSFLFGYRSAYNALKNDSSFSYVVFFLVYFIHIGINIYYTLGIPGGGSCGFINATSAIHHSIPVGGMMFAAAVLFLLGVIADIVMLLKIHRIYRMAGASFEKAQGEFARGVASNEHVQNAAAAGVRSAVVNQK